MDVLANSLVPEEIDHSTVMDDFFTDPDSVREIALKQLEQHTEIINDKGVFYPGIRVSLTDDVGLDIVDKITKHIKRRPVEFKPNLPCVIEFVPIAAQSWSSLLIKED